jgi:hypothetical protein
VTRALVVALLVLGCGREVARPTPAATPTSATPTSGPRIPTVDEVVCVQAHACCLELTDLGYPCVADEELGALPDRTAERCRALLERGRVLLRANGLSSSRCPVR